MTKKTKASARQAALPVLPIEPRYIVERHALGANGEMHTRHLPVICTDCEARFLGRWSENGRPLYEGGWRLVRYPSKEGPDFPTWAYAPCRCVIGQMVSAGNSRQKPPRPGYPPNEAMAWARTPDPETGETLDPWKFHDYRNPRPITDNELADWRMTHRRGESEAVADWMESSATEPPDGDMF